MPSGAKRRKAAKKKKEKTQTAISNVTGEVKVVESDGGENSSPAFQDFEPHQNPFTKDEEKQPSVENGKTEDGSLRDSSGNGKTVDLVGEAKSQNGGKAGSLSDSDGDGNVVEIVGEAKSQNGGKAGVDAMEDSNGKLTAERDVQAGLDEPEINIVAESESFGVEVVLVEDSARVARVAESNRVAAEKAVQVQVPAPESESVEKPVGSTLAESKSKKHEDTVHPSDTFPVSDYLQPLLRTAPRQADKASWTGCCGLLELFTGSSGQNLAQ